MRELLANNPPRTTPYNIENFHNGIVRHETFISPDGARGPLGLPLLLGEGRYGG